MHTAPNLVSLLLEDEPDFDADEYMAPEPIRISARKSEDGTRYYDSASGSYLLVSPGTRNPVISLAYVEETTDDTNRVRIGLELLRHALKEMTNADHATFHWWTFLVDKYKVNGNVETDDPASLWNLVEKLEKEHLLEITGTSGAVMYARLL